MDAIEMQDIKAMTNPVPITRTFLVARDGHADETGY